MPHAEHALDRINFQSFPPTCRCWFLEPELTFTSFRFKKEIELPSSSKTDALTLNCSFNFDKTVLPKICAFLQTKHHPHATSTLSVHFGKDMVALRTTHAKRFRKEISEKPVPCFCTKTLAWEVLGYDVLSACQCHCKGLCLWYT